MRPTPDHRAPESVLVHVGLDRLGDGLLKLPFVRGLRAAFPAARLTWFAGKETTVYAGALKPLITGLLDEVIERGGVGVHPRELLRPRPLAGRSFDLVIDTQKILWTSLSARRIRHRRFVSPAARFWLSDAKPARGYRQPRAMQRQLLDLLEIASGGSFASPSRLEIDVPEDARAQARHLLPPGHRYVGFAPGSGGRPKCWPLDRFLAVAENAAKVDDVPVFLIGPQEEDWARTVAERLPGARLPLQDGMGAAAHGYDPLLTIALGERLAAAVSNDSGIAHMLAVAGAPLAVLYGPTVHEKFPPMTETIEVVRAQDFGAREMTAIPVDAVMDALRRLPRRGPAS